MKFTKILIEFFKLFFDNRKSKKKIISISESSEFDYSLHELFSEAEYKKIIENAILVNHAILQPLCFLLGRKPSSIETKLQILISFCSSIQDNLVDSPNRENYDKKNDLIQQMGVFIRSNIPNRELFELFLKNTAEAQNRSKEQFNENISLNELEQITFSKCGNAFLVIRSILPEPIILNETEAIYQYGGTAQIGDDILDLYDDISNKQYTLATNLELKQLTELFNNELIKTYSGFYMTKHDLKNIRKAVMRISIFLSVFNLGLKRYEKLNINTTDRERIRRMERTHFIIDMAKAGNIFKLFLEVLKTTSYINRNIEKQKFLF